MHSLFLEFNSYDANTFELESSDGNLTMSGD